MHRHTNTQCTKRYMCTDTTKVEGQERERGEWERWIHSLDISKGKYYVLKKYVIIETSGMFNN